VKLARDASSLELPAQAGNTCAKEKGASRAVDAGGEAVKVAVTTAVAVTTPLSDEEDVVVKAGLAVFVVEGRVAEGSVVSVVDEGSDPLFAATGRVTVGSTVVTTVTITTPSVASGEGSDPSPAN
jgi:hypothetical protein